MKRRCVETVASCTRSKKPKLWSDPSHELDIEYISATCTRNFMLKDPLVDWLKSNFNSKYKSKYKSIFTDNDDGFYSFIMNKGVEFEAELIKYINQHRLPVVTVSQYITKESINKTIELMKLGTPIIHSAPVQNPENHTHGIIDILIRSDHLHLLVDDYPLTDEEKIIQSPNLGHNFHYVVIDVKFSTLPLRADGKHILNSGNYPAYKAQCHIYNEAVGHIQGYTSKYAFILGRRWTYTQKDISYNNLNCLNKLGVIDYEKIDNSYIQETENALKWIRETKKHGHKWSISPPSRPELYPNMCHDSGKWQAQKEKIAEDIGEITSIWYCGVKNRNIGIQAGITSWKHPKCVSANIGVRGLRAPIIDSIIDINRQTIDKIRPQNIKNNLFNWKYTENEIFVDFETMCDIFSPFSELPEQKKTDMIFMIGVWYKHKQTGNNNSRPTRWTYKRFTSNKATYEEEYRIMNEFNEFLKEYNNPKIWFWCAENRFWKTAENRQFDRASEEGNKEKMDHISNNWSIDNWSDMCELFKKEPIVIKDCFKFGLKPIAKAMHKHGLISTKLESECSSGMSAMVKAWRCYNESESPATCPVMQDIAKYNRFDVCVLEDILTYLRKNHT
jgi:hypothetical protein